MIFRNPLPQVISSSELHFHASLVMNPLRIMSSKYTVMSIVMTNSTSYQNENMNQNFTCTLQYSVKKVKNTGLLQRLAKPGFGLGMDK